MANFRYFSDRDGEAIPLQAISTLDNQVFAERFPGIRGIRSDGFSKLVGKAELIGPYLPVTRRIEYKRNPSLHACNAKCMNGKPTGTCECKCGGRNHGRSAFAS